MGSEMIRTMGVIVLVAASAGLMGCPPQEEGPPPEPEVYDIKDYWPMAVGNEWEWVNVLDGDTTKGVITDEYTSGPYTIWEMLFTDASDPSDPGEFVYFVLHPDYLLYTNNEDSLSSLPDDPNDLDALQGFIPIMQRNITEGVRPHAYREDNFTTTDTVDNLTPFEACIEHFSDECVEIVWEASDFPVSPDTHSILWTSTETHENGDFHERVEGWFALDVGPLVFLGESLLIRALVDGVEYSN